MTERVDRNQQTSQMIDRQLKDRAKEIAKKQSNEFQLKLMTQGQQGAKAKQAGIANEVLARYAKGEEVAKAPASPLREREEPGHLPKKLLKEEQSKETQKKQDTKQAHQDKQVEKKSGDVALQIAVQRKQQEDQQNEGFGSSGGGDFFHQAVSMGMAVRQAETIEAHHVQIPEEALNQIVERVAVGVNPEGDSQFVIDLKQGVLGGGQIQVSAQGKNIRLKFGGLDPASKQTVRMASDTLRSRLASKGLKLDDLDVA